MSDTTQARNRTRARQEAKARPIAFRPDHVGDYWQLDAYRVALGEGGTEISLSELIRYLVSEGFARARKRSLVTVRAEILERRPEGEQFDWEALESYINRRTESETPR